MKHHKKHILSITKLIILNLFLLTCNVNAQNNDTTKQVMLNPSTMNDNHHQSSIWMIKTNLAVAPLLTLNVAAEASINNQYSIQLPIYYSAWDYGTRITKFRTFAIQPELRYWLKQTQHPYGMGWFTNIHLGLFYYNIATGSSYRYQDHNGNSPAWGGGFGIGYRRHLDKHQHWLIEFEFGIGQYSMHTDRYLNRGNGWRTDSYQHIYFGPDQLAVNIVYRFAAPKTRKP